MKLWKTTIVIWSDSDPQGAEIDDLARDAMVGDSFCSKQEILFVQDAEEDPDWVPTEFFDMGGEES